MSERDSFDLTPQQYHAGLDRLWCALGVDGVQEDDVFTLCAKRIAEVQRERDEAQRILKVSERDRDTLRRERDEALGQAADAEREYAQKGGYLLARLQQAEQSRDKLRSVLDEVIQLFEKCRESFGCDDTSDLYEQCEFEDHVCKLICKAVGHDIGPDQCGRPEHDLCYRCRRLRVDIESEGEDE